MVTNINQRSFGFTEIQSNNSIIKVERISDWRKNIAIFKYSNKFYLIDSQNTILYKTNTLNNEEREVLSGQRILRTFGGKYIVLDVYSTGCVTYPGKDRETKYFYKECISTIIDENGNVEESTFYGPLKEDLTSLIDVPNICLDLGEGLTVYKNAIYILSDYTKITDIPFEIENISYFSDGLCKFNVIDHYEEFYVVCQNKKIVEYYNKQTFESIESILRGLYEFSWRNSEEKIDPEFINKTNIQKKEQVEKFFESPQFDLEIENYLYTSSESFLFEFNNTDLIGASIEKCITDIEISIANWYTGIIVNSGSKFRNAIEELIAFNKTIPNFVTAISKQGVFEYKGKVSFLYKFECKPFGYFSKTGQIIYDFTPDKYNFM